MLRMRLLLLFVSVFNLPILVSAQTAAQSYPQAIGLGQQSVAMLTRGTAISDVTLTGNVTQIYGSDSETGTGTFSAKGTNESRVDLVLSGGSRSDVRNAIGGDPRGAWSANGATAKAYAGHNCWTDAVWFFPALSSLAQFSNPGFVFKYIGPELHGGANVQHIRVSQAATNDPRGTVQQLSIVDFYLDTNSNLPHAIAVNIHPDKNMGINIPLELCFADYQAVAGVLVPVHFQQMLNGGVVLDVRVTNVKLNTNLLDALFALP